MTLELQVFGLALLARCRYIKGFPGTYYEPPEPPDVEVLSLEVLPGGEDATFLLDSTLADRIIEAARDEIDTLVADEAAYIADMRHDERRERELLTG